MVRKNAVEVGVHGGSKKKRTINEGLVPFHVSTTKESAGTFGLVGIFYLDKLCD
jgi:hypothetical protein